jgi:uncharacterized membrane protein
MSGVPVHLVVAVFADEQLAKKALEELKQAQKVHLFALDNAAILFKDAHSRLVIKEIADMGGAKGAALGGVAGAAIGVIAGSALLVPAAVGALVGGLAARLCDSSFPDERLKNLGVAMRPDSAAIVAVVEHRWVAQVEQALAAAGADLFTEELGADTAGQLEAGQRMAYTAISSEHGFRVVRTSGGGDGSEGSQVVIIDSGAYGGQFVATDRGFTVVASDSAKESLLVNGLPSTMAYENGEEIEPAPDRAE